MSVHATIGKSYCRLWLDYIHKSAPFWPERQSQCLQTVSPVWNHEKGKAVSCCVFGFLAKVHPERSHLFVTISWHIHLNNKKIPYPLIGICTKIKLIFPMLHLLPSFMTVLFTETRTALKTKLILLNNSTFFYNENENTASLGEGNIHVENILISLKARSQFDTGGTIQTYGQFRVTNCMSAWGSWREPTNSTQEVARWWSQT